MADWTQTGIPSFTNKRWQKLKRQNNKYRVKLKLWRDILERPEIVKHSQDKEVNGMWQP